MLRHPARARASDRARPAGYPDSLEHELRLSDGRAVFVRPVLPDDRDQLRAAIAAADPATLHARFLGAAPPTSNEDLRHLVELDYRRRLAVAAFAEDGQGVAIARYEAAAEDNTAEVAVAVDPRWRHVGLATDLVHTLAEAALDNGIERFTALSLASNQDVRDLIRHSGAEHEESGHDGVVEASIDLRS
jgi:GNAT superfamily N-acetyltransferase